MEDGWERPPRAELGPERLNQLIEPAFSGKQVSESAVLTTGLANTMVRFRLLGDDAAYVLRLHTRDPDAAVRERAIMRRLAAESASIPLAPLVYSHPPSEPGGPAYSIWGFVEGTLLQHLFRTLTAAELVNIAGECGRVLAAIAAHPFARCGELGAELEVVSDYGQPSEFIPRVIQRGLFQGRAGQRLGTRLRDALWSAVERSAPLLRSIDYRYGLVHADYKRSNLLLRAADAGWKLSAVLDWEFAFAGPPLIDVGLFLRAGPALPAGFREEFTSCYLAAGGWLPNDWLPLSRLVDVVSQIHFLDDVNERPRVFAESTNVLKETLRILS